MRIIDTAQQKIKRTIEHPLYDTIVWLAILLCVILSSFFSGMKYQQYLNRKATALETTYNEQAIELWEAYQSAKQEKQFFFASRNGSVVYPADCTRGNRIKEENKIYFDDINDAFELGYREASGC